MKRLGIVFSIFGALLVWSGTTLAVEKQHHVAPPAVPVLAALASPEYPDLYVDAIRGENTDACGTSLEDPCRTIQAALDKVQMVLHKDVTVHIAPGSYPGDILIAGRTSPNNSTLHLIGESDGTIITGPGEARTGISVIQSHNVVLENMEVRGYSDAGIRFIFSPNAQVKWMTLSNNGDGLFLGESETTVIGSVFRENQARGVICEGGWVTFATGKDVATQYFIDNQIAGLQVAGCYASLESAVSITGGENGMLSVHGGEIDMNMRTDIGIYQAAGLSALTADCHGMIAGFGNTCIGSCACTASRYGVCEAGAIPGRRGGRGNHRVTVPTDPETMP